jgi:hypothetical protein
MSAQLQSPAAPERRHNHSLRHQAQAWFEALQLQVTEIEGAETIAVLMKGWKKTEDVMRAYPALVPLFLDMAWRSRKSAGFADLFRTDTGEVAETTTQILALSQKCFDDIVIAHLQGTMRLTAERRQNEWLAIERERRRGTLSKIPIVGTALRSVGLLTPVKTQILLADYPQKGLYDALKPSLHHRSQFALVDALSALPTRTVAALGPVVGLLESPAVIHALADLDRGAVKIAIEMVETYVQVVSGAPADTSPDDFAPPRAAALSAMMAAASHFVALAGDHRQLAKDAITKFAPVMKDDVWTLFTDADSLRRIAECPAGVAANLRDLTVWMNERVSLALSELADDRIAVSAMETLRGITNAEIFMSWIREETYVSAWKQLVQHLNRDTMAPPPGQSLGPNQKAAIKAACVRGVRVFEDIANPQKQAA